MNVSTAILAVLVGVGFIMMGVGKLADMKMMSDVRHHLGLPSVLFKVIGALEILGGIGIMLGLHSDLATIGVLAGVGLVGMTIGAGFYHQKAGDSMKGRLPAVIAGSLIILYIILRIGSA
jgi:uncharacterized membrane protein YphA (DoxX/SURF4 family)